MINKSRTIRKTIDVDSYREKGLGEKDSVLLYDSTIGAYYVTTISDIVSFVLAKQEKDLIRIQAEFEELKKGNQESLNAIRAEQKKFILDTVQTNEALIQLVKNGGAQ